MASAEQEKIWAEQLDRSRTVFEMRVVAAYRMIDRPGARLSMYQDLRAQIGDDSAREVAKFTESLISGKISWPKWFKTNQPQ